jgi:cysteinyl-tRNA synthetase
MGFSMAETPKLRLYNTLTKAKEDFVPLDAKNVRMYVCGPTVYDFAHIGNARPVIVFDVLFRLLRHLYGPEHVTYARNITDIDDKINKRAFERWTKKRPLLDEVRALTEVTAKQYEDDVAALGNLPPTYTPRATDFVCNGSQPMDMVRVIERLVQKKHAYVVEGHVLFDVLSWLNYGNLSRRSLKEMEAGARVEVAPYKSDPMDFVLWKPSDREREPGWDSPWGFGRPGWHIECSAMSAALLGQQFDIHAGGIDLIFPHHENEIAQTCCAFGVDKMASVWMHNGFLQVEGQKMSKSDGNFFTIREVLNDWPGEVVRLNMLKTHYRQPIDWTVRGLEESERTITAWYKKTMEIQVPPAVPAAAINALSDDLNLPKVIAEMHGMNASELDGAMTLLGFYDVRARGVAANEAEIDKSIEIGVLISARLSARRAKNFAESDRIRDELLAMGIQLKDGKDPATGEPVTTWEVKR